MANNDSLLHYRKDSLATAVDHGSRSLFYNHELQPIHSTPVFTTVRTSYWPGIVLFLILSIYVLIKVTEPKKIVRVFLSVFSLQEAKQLFREEFKLTKRFSIFLVLCFILVGAFLIYVTNRYFGLILQNHSPLNQYAFFVALITISYLVKFTINYFLAFVSASSELGREYIFNVVVFAQTIGIVLFPFVVAMQFTSYPPEWFLYPSLVICLGFFVLRLFRGFLISVSEQNVGIIYIFLYLCGLEILPLLILIKFLMTNF
ncbi:MAG: hypothetical protein K0R26_2172 [Bacteroidota bacterium]|nr:hypothetical protein [Bacteroidota bacterium]